MGTPDPGRWTRLFADLAGQYDAAEAAELDQEVRERARGEAARLELVDRLRAAVGLALAVDTSGDGTLHGRLAEVGPDWLLLDDGRDVLVPLSAVLAVAGLSAWSADPHAAGPVARRLGLRHALREVARRRAAVVVTLVDGRRLHGTVDRVGADFLELAEHPPGEERRGRAVRAVRTVPFAALATIRAG